MEFDHPEFTWLQKLRIRQKTVEFGLSLDLVRDTELILDYGCGMSLEARGMRSQLGLT